MADIELTVIGVKNLGGTNGGKCDAYCVVRVGKDRHTTKTVSKTKNPVWNYVLKLHNIAETQVQFVVWDKTLFSNEVAGLLDLDLTSLPNGVEVEHSFELRKEKSIASYGEIQLKMKYTKLTSVPRVHTFKLHNFSHPVWCHTCEKFIWGLARQGVKCSECGYKAHYKCSQRRDLSSCGTPLKQEPEEHLLDLSDSDPVSHSTESAKDSVPQKVASARKLHRRSTHATEKQKRDEARLLADSYLEKATQAAQEALDEDMSHHFREAKELYETSIASANVGFDVRTQKLISDRINDYLERVEELVDVIEEEEQEKQLDILLKNQFGDPHKQEEEQKKKAEEEAQKKREEEAAKKLEEERKKKEEERVRLEEEKRKQEEKQKELAKQKALEEAKKKKEAEAKQVKPVNPNTKPSVPARSVAPAYGQKPHPALAMPEVKSSVLNLKSIHGATTKEENLEKTRRKFLLRAPSVVSSNRKLIDEDEVALLRYPQLKTIVDRCKSSGEKFVDKDFPTQYTSIYKDHTSVSEANKKLITWKRLADMVPESELFVNGVEPGDVIQGALGDCWFLGPLSVIADKTELLNKIFITTAINDYGVYAFQFFKAGRWFPVIIDDFVPVDAKTGALVYAHCKDPTELWVPLVEKAYAKLHSCYEAIESGTETNAFLDLTACPPEERNLNENIQKDEVFDWILKNTQSGHLLGCSWVTPQKTASNGILPNHAYGILAAQKIDGHSLIKLRNPWGQGEWTGRWADDSNLWTPELKKKLNLVEANDGCFWMCAEDFMQYFNTYYKCNIIGADKKRTPVYGEWSKGSAGGCTDNITWRNNPQYLLTVKKAEKVSIMITQPERRSRTKDQYPHIGFYVVKTEETIVNTENLVDGTRFQDSRDLSAEFDLEPGHYAVIPCTYKPDIEMPFILTIFSSESLELRPAKNWLTVSVDGEWSVANNTAGGCANTPLWKQNDQYLLTVSKAEEINLMLCRTKDFNNDMYVGFYVLQSEDDKKVTSLRAKLAMTTYANTDITLPVQLEPGTYIIIPTTFDSGEEGKFRLSASTRQTTCKLQLL